MKKLLLWTLALLLAHPIVAQTFEYEGINYSVNDATAWTVTATGPVDKATLTHLNLPDVVHYYRSNADGTTDNIICHTTRLSDAAFQNCPLLESVRLPETLAHIGWSTFSGCNYLEEIVMPAALKYIGRSAFAQCGVLRKVTLNEGLTMIDMGAFGNNVALREITFPSTMEVIDQNSFSGCSSLRKVTFNGAVPDMRSWIFTDCKALKEVNAPSIEAWLNMGFSNGESNPAAVAQNLSIGGEPVIDLVIPASVSKINPYAFMNLGTLKSVKVEGTVKTIGEYSFAYAPNLESIDFGEGVETIGHRAFSGCAIKELTLPNSLTILGASCFDSCKSLERINFGSGLEKMDGAFFDCPSLKAVNVTDLSQWCKMEFPASNDSNPLETAHTFMVNGTVVEDLAIPSDVVSISANALCGGYFKSITIPDNVKTIGDGYTFGRNPELEYVSIGSGIKNLDLKIFSWSENIITFRIEDGTSPIVVVDGYGWSTPTSRVQSVYVGRETTLNCTFCPNAYYLTLGPSVEYADGLKLESHNSLCYINSLNPVPPVISDLTEAQYEKIVVKVPEGSADAYRRADGWKNFAHIYDTPDYELSNVKIELDKTHYSIYQSNVVYPGVLINFQPEAFSYTMTPSAFSCLPVVMTSSDTNVVTINDQFVPAYRNVGEATITARIVGLNAEATCHITTYPLPASVTLESGPELALTVDDTYQFVCTVAPVMIEPNMITWTSSDPEVLEIDENGLATAKAPGNATVIVKTYNGDSATCKVTVAEKSGIAEIEFDAEQPVDVYTLTGIKVMTGGNMADVNALPAGIYIISQGSKTKKHLVTANTI